MSHYKYTNGISVHEHGYDKFVNTTRMDNRESFTILCTTTELAKYYFVIMTNSYLCRIYAIAGIPRSYNNNTVTPVYNIPAIADYYSQIDQSDDQQIMDYHNFCMKTSKQIFRALKDISTASNNTKRAN